MQLTAQLRLYDLPESTTQRLDALGAYHGRLLHLLYAWVARHGGSVMRHKTAFCRAYGVSSRFFNALRVELQGLIDGTTELLKAKEKDLTASLRALRKKLDTFEQKFHDIAADRKRVSTKTYLGWRAQQRKAEAKLNRLEHKLASVRQRLAANVPGIGFGSRKLFKKQFFLAENGYANHAAWRRDWRAARSHQCFFLGSKDETGGNQQCTMTVNADGTFDVRIRMPDALCSRGDSPYEVLKALRLPYAHAELLTAYANGQALTWRLHRDTTGWRLFVAFARPAGQARSLDKQFGVVGVDFNADHLAVTETDLHGNPLRTRRFTFSGETSGQRAASLADALEAAVLWAETVKKPLAIEDLDFTAKKKALKAMSPAQARALSGLPYAKYQQLAASKCHLRGVQLLKINPAHTSVVGRLKYAQPRGWSVHQAAAGAIARRAQGYAERLPRAPEVRLPAQGTTLRFPVPVRKAGAPASVSWQKVGVALRGFLREHWLATHPPVRGRGAQGRSRGRGQSPDSPSGAAVRPAATSSRLNDEQICAVCS